MELISSLALLSVKMSHVLWNADVRALVMRSGDCWRVINRTGPFPEELAFLRLMPRLMFRHELMLDGWSHLPRRDEAERGTENVLSEATAEQCKGSGAGKLHRVGACLWPWLWWLEKRAILLLFKESGLTCCEVKTPKLKEYTLSYSSTLPSK